MNVADEFRLQELLGNLEWLDGSGILDETQREFLKEVIIGVEDALSAEHNDGDADGR